MADYRAQKDQQGQTRTSRDQKGVTETNKKQQMEELSASHLAREKFVLDRNLRRMRVVLVRLSKL